MKYLQAVSIFVNNAGMFSLGFGIGFLVPYEDQVRADFSLSPTDMTWLVSSLTCGAVVGCLVGPPLSHHFSRRLALTICFFTILLGWICLALGTHITMITIGRIMHGFGECMFTIVAAMYIGELALPNYRGIVIATHSVTIWLGVLTAYSLGLVLPWRWAVLPNVLITVCGLLCLTLLPESPSWLEERGRTEEAKEAMYQLWGEVIEIELVSVSKARKETETRAWHVRLHQAFLSFNWQLLVPPALLFILPFCGAVSLTLFALKLVSRMGIDNPHMVSIVIAGVRVFAAVGCMWSIHRLGRRNTLIVSSILVLLCNGGIACLLQFLHLDILEQKLTWDICLSCLLVLLMIFTGVGINPVPWVLCVEWPTMEHKAFINGMANICFYFGVFLTVHLTALMDATVTTSAMFGFFSMVSILFLVIVLLWAPETHGECLQRSAKDSENETKLTPEAGLKMSSNLQPWIRWNKQTGDKV